MMCVYIYIYIYINTFYTFCSEVVTVERSRRSYGFLEERGADICIITTITIIIVIIIIIIIIIICIIIIILHYWLTIIM